MIKSMQVKDVPSSLRAEVPVLQPDEKEKLERGFAEGEASQRLEGLELGEPYWTVKARILAGEITFDQGLEEIAAYHRPRVSAVA
jgi:hypothetical protein